MLYSDVRMFLQQHMYVTANHNLIYPVSQLVKVYVKVT